LHEASVIATKERPEMKMFEFFIAKRIVVDGAGHSITKSLVVKRAGFRSWHPGGAWSSGNQFAF